MAEFIPMANQHNPANPGGWICHPVITDCQRRQLYERVVARGREIVECPDSDSLKEYHQLLNKTFGVGEVEPLEKLQNELAGNHEAGSTARYICILLRDPAAEDRIACGMYGSVQDGVLAVRFVVTVQDKVQQQDYRGTGISQEICCGPRPKPNIGPFHGRARRSGRAWGNASIDPKCFSIAYSDCSDSTFPVRGCRTAGNPLRASASRQARPDGTPLDPMPQLEDLQIAAAGHSGRLPLAVPERIVTAFWRNWYVCPEKEFASQASWQRHCQCVIEETLGGRILEPLRYGACLFRGEEREERGQEAS